MWLIPTLNRADGIAKLIASMQACGEVPEAAVMIDRDGSEGGYCGVTWPANWHIHHAEEHLEFIAGLNALQRLHPDEPWYGVLPDHSRPVSEHWSTRLVAACAGGWSNAVNAGKINSSTGCQKLAVGVMDARIVHAAGWVFPDWLTHFYGDTLLEEVLQDAGLWRQTDVVIGIDKIRNHPRVHKGIHYHDEDRRKWAAWRDGGGVQSMISMLRAAGLC